MSIYLYVAQHNQTGIKYFGKTVRGNPVQIGYQGSGTRWRRILKKHGRDVDLQVIAEFEGIEEASEFALQFSEDNNIVESDEWANLIPENAIDGWPAGVPKSDETKLKLSIANKGKKLSSETKLKLSIANKGKKLSSEIRRKMSERLKGKKLSTETRLKMSISQKGNKKSSKTRLKMSISQKGKKKPQRKISQIKKGWLESLS